VEGMHVITVEGIGNQRQGLHPVQVLPVYVLSRTFLTFHIWKTILGSVDFDMWIKYFLEIWENESFRMKQVYFVSTQDRTSLVYVSPGYLG
jgi:hypothetical protein